MKWAACCVLLALPTRVLPADLKKAADPKTPDPKITSLFPVSIVRGAHSDAILRGSDLAGARALVFDDSGITGRVINIEKETVQVELAAASDAAQGWHSFRVVTAAGVTNELRVMAVSEPVINRRIEHPGDVGTFAIDPKPGETLTIEAVSGYAAFDPTITLFEETATWFDPHRLNRVAFNDDPLPFPGLSTDARLVYRFPHSGKYTVQVNSFDGKGGPDYAYLLRISHGETPPPPLHPELKADWGEREFTRTIADNWLQELTKRGGGDEKPQRPELFRAVPEGSDQIPVVTMPAMVEGRISKPGETHLIRVKVEQAANLAIEVETPRATLPRFNPVVRLMQPDGHEMATDVYTKLNNNGLYMMKMIEPKTALGLQAPGEYTIAIRDITTDCAGEDFVYRVLIRKQIPHVGAIDIPVDHVNLEPGTVKPVSVKIDREEGFAGYVAVTVKGLPPGVTALQAMEQPEDKPPLPNAGKAERYFAKDQETAVILAAAADAPVTSMPVKARVELSVVNQGKLGPVFAVREIPVMVVERKP